MVMSKNKSKEKIAGTEEAWEDGSLGLDEASAVVSDLIDMDGLDEATELQPISIRIQKSILHDLKLIAKLHGIGYQPLIKQLLKRFVISEAKKFLRDHAPAITEESFNADCTEDPVEEEPR